MGHQLRAAGGGCQAWGVLGNPGLEATYPYLSDLNILNDFF